MAQSDHVCGRCGHEFCRECVVFPAGIDKMPICITCALEAGGIRRQHTGRPKLSKRQVKKRVTAHEMELAARVPVPLPPEEDSHDEEDRWMSGLDDPSESGGWSAMYD